MMPLKFDEQVPDFENPNNGSINVNQPLERKFLTTAEHSPSIPSRGFYGQEDYDDKSEAVES